MRKRHNNVSVDPRVTIRLVPDGEVHIMQELPLEYLEIYARAWLDKLEGKTDVPVYLVLRLRSVEAIDYLMDELQKARKEITNARNNQK